uniref:Uncharacterized protein n=1 Tax=Anas zonorhyncha TaxID=75864 RepID=A0A8B9UFX0_9AVES
MNVAYGCIHNVNSYVKNCECSFSIPLKTPLKMLDVSNCSLNHDDMAYLANSLHSYHLEVLDLSGHDIPGLYPSTFFKLLSHSSSVLRSLILEDCNIQDSHVNMLILGLSPCHKLQDFKFLGNPLSSEALKQLFTWLSSILGKGREGKGREGKVLGSTTSSLPLNKELYTSLVLENLAQKKNVWQEFKYHDIKDHY